MTRRLNVEQSHAQRECSVYTLRCSFGALIHHLPGGSRQISRTYYRHSQVTGRLPVVRRMQAVGSSTLEHTLPTIEHAAERSWNGAHRSSLTLDSMETMFPGPLAEAIGCFSGTSTGETNTDNFSSWGETMAVPRSLMVDRIILAYSKSTLVRLEMPWQGTCETAQATGRLNNENQVRSCQRGLRRDVDGMATEG